MTGKIYYHGTYPRSLYSIATQGFKLGEYMHGRVHGEGLYIATKPETAGIWAGSACDHDDRNQYAVKCQLQRGTKILWKDLDYDKKVIRYLEKEFGKRISRDYDFWKYIPSNKRLTNSELMALVSHLDYVSLGMSFWTRKGDKFSTKKYRHMARFSKIIRQYGYDALGDRTESCWDSDDICVYNPSKVDVVSIHRIEVDWGPSGNRSDHPQHVDYSHPLSLEELKDISEKDEADWQRLLAKWAADDAEI